MKTIKSILILSLLSITMASVAGVKETKTVTFDVNVHCSSCKEKIEKNIAFEKGVKDLIVDMELKKVTITFEVAKTNEEKLIAAFKKIGYDATVSGCCDKNKKPCGKEGEKPCSKPCSKPCGKK